jgi:hypothetical protein
MLWNDGIVECWPALARLSYELLLLVYDLSLNFINQAFDKIGLGQGMSDSAV